MARTRNLWLAAAVSVAALGSWNARPAAQSAPAEPAPTFELDPAWPKPLPNNWGLGMVWGVAVDASDHVWVVHQIAGQKYAEQIATAGKVPAPAVLEFDQGGNLLQAWGVPGQGGWTQGKGRPFPAQSLSIDWKGNVWVSEETRGNAIVKFTRDGKFLLQIGEVDKTNGSADPKLLGGPSGMSFDPSANEVYVADGYINKRVIVFDADTGAYKRHWGRYGKPPDDTFEADKPGVPRFGHGVNVSRDKLVYVADRSHNSIHVHKPDGAFIREVSLPGPINSVAFSPDPEQRYLYGGGMNSTATIYVLRRSDVQLLGSFKSAGQHFFTTDSKGNLFTCGLFMPQKFVLKNVPARTPGAQ
jgi:sugar lactone lactonase YvrE